LSGEEFEGTIDEVAKAVEREISVGSTYLF
jgi:hypothetical protein